MEHAFERAGGRRRRVSLYAGIDLSYLDLASDPLSVPCEAPGHLLQIHYCKAGQAVWETGGGSIFLNPGDFAVHGPGVCTGSSFRFPAGRYRGLTVSVDLMEASAHPPGPIAEAGLFDGVLREKFCGDRAVAFLAGTEPSERIFAGFYDQPEELKLPYQRLKVLELLLYLAQPEFAPQDRLAEYQAKQVEIVRDVHDRLLRHMDRRVTIEALAKEYLINPTTLKSAFKAVYGTSLAAHIKKHRMEQAAKLLRETDRSVAEIAQAVGYDSQSKFAAAFKSLYQVLPREYRKK